LLQLSLGFGAVAVAIEVFLAGPARRSQEKEAAEEHREEKLEATHGEDPQTWAST
jgi:hypothetical protein